MALPKRRVVVRPESESKLSQLATRLLHEASAMNVLPTPIDRLFEVAKVKHITELPDERFFESLPEKARNFFRAALQKIRGIADLRERAIYVPAQRSEPRGRFVQAHELGHQVISWQKIDPAYLDDDETLSPEVRNTFEQEANFFGAEIIFQGRKFRTLARDFQPSFEAIFSLADTHGASKQATAWRFVEEQDEAIALVLYYPGNSLDTEGNNVLNLWRSVQSPAFIQRYSSIDLPATLRTGHDWVAARDCETICRGVASLPVDSENVGFRWSSWWNGYTLLILLRKSPLLGVIGEFINR